MAKAAVVIVLCAPLGFCLGMFMPLAITLVATDEEHSSEYVAWGWAINGFFSVIGSTLTTIVSMSYGFRVVLLSAVRLYLIVIALCGAWSATPHGERRRRRQPSSYRSDGHGPRAGASDAHLHIMMR